MSAGDDFVFIADPRCGIAPSDLLRAEGTVRFITDTDTLRSTPNTLFRVEGSGFSFTFRIEPGRLLFQRNNDVVILEPDMTERGGRRKIAAGWHPTELKIYAKYDGNTTFQKASRITPQTLPPALLLRAARAQHLAPTVIFESQAAFRSSVHEMLNGVRDKIVQLGAGSPFWNTSRSKNRKLVRSPKIEVDTHPTLHLLFWDWALLKGVDIVPENQTGAGDVDFALIGAVAELGAVPFCIEVKLAHSDDLVQGLERQLPEYMSRKGAPFGAYLVLWFRGDLFSRPTDAEILRLRRAWQPGYETVTDDPLREFSVALRHPDNIRVVIIDVTKPSPASKL
jgi:hypothetical protein